MLCNNLTKEAEVSQPAHLLLDQIKTLQRTNSSNKLSNLKLPADLLKARTANSGISVTLFTRFSQQELQYRDLAPNFHYPAQVRLPSPPRVLPLTLLKGKTKHSMNCSGFFFSPLL